MKTKKILLSGLILALFCSTSLFASNSNARATARAESNLKQQIQKEFKTLPLHEIAALDKCCSLVIKFTVNENNELVVLNLKSENEDLLRHGEIILKENDVVSSELLQGKRYIVKLRFDYRT